MAATLDVSIHAPAWGATQDLEEELPISLVSIHAPAWGATGQAQAYPIPGTGFNPRTRVGCDESRSSRPTSEERFNPRTRVGCDTRGVFGRID